MGLFFSSFLFLFYPDSRVRWSQSPCDRGMQPVYPGTLIWAQEKTEMPPNGYQKATERSRVKLTNTRLPIAITNHGLLPSISLITSPCFNAVASTRTRMSKIRFRSRLSSPLPPHDACLFLWVFSPTLLSVGPCICPWSKARSCLFASLDKCYAECDERQKRYRIILKYFPHALSAHTHLCVSKRVAMAKASAQS